MSNYKITAEENVPFQIKEGYEIVTEDNEGLLRKKLSPGKEFISGDYVAVIEKSVVQASDNDGCTM